MITAKPETESVRLSAPLPKADQQQAPRQPETMVNSPIWHPSQGSMQEAPLPKATTLAPLIATLQALSSNMRLKVLLHRGLGPGHAAIGYSAIQSCIRSPKY